jgi:hypothetical protein
MLELSTRQSFEAANAIFKYEMITILQEALYTVPTESNNVWCKKDAIFFQYGHYNRGKYV